MRMAARASMAVFMAVGCTPTASEKRDPSPAPVEASADVAVPVGAASLLDAQVPEASVPTEATMRLLVERVMSHNGQTPDHFLAYDLVVLSEVTGQSGPRRVHPFCPPAKKDMFGICRRFRACAPADGGQPEAVACDGKTFVLMQRAGATYLKEDEREMIVVQGLPAIGLPLRRDRLANVDL